MAPMLSPTTKFQLDSIDPFSTLAISDVLFDDLTSELSPIHRLPAEIVGEIFLEYVLSFSWPDSPSKCQFAPLTLTWICSRWRDISVSTASLWVFHYIPPHSALIGRPSTIYDHLDHYTILALSHSKSCRLHVSINNSTVSAADLLFAVSDRWKSARFTIGGSLPRSLTQRGLPRRYTLEVEFKSFPKHQTYPCLENLTIESDDYDYPIPLFLNSPHLRTLCLTNMRSQWPDENSLPWSQIQNFAGRVSLPFVYRLLKLCPQLKRLDIVQERYPPLVLPEAAGYPLPAIASGTWYSHEYTPISSGSPDFPQVDAPHLHSLCVSTATDQPSLTNWLRFTPSLISIDLKGDPNTSEAIHKQIVLDLIAFLRRSDCQLESLALSSVDIRPTQFIELFTLLPELKVLDFGAHDVPRTYLEALCDKSVLRRLTAPPIIAADKHEVLLPRLISIRLYLPTAPMSSAFEKFLGFLESRRPLDIREKDGIAYLDKIEFSGWLCWNSWNSTSFDPYFAL
ncbi:hypothetical protein BDP27DRAFT_1312951 [Rhodocollybia butyracea]|uniref:F-box domain-containing protein n=1 Tax=Rhodocollybia butyracea TaxID=206335 RepID=A0A9P5UG35_9AGAR|nr:hypothetical protein BDP27DRAFT_1312951 [Rhodocollybia butyracea]